MNLRTKLGMAAFSALGSLSPVFADEEIRLTLDLSVNVCESAGHTATCSTQSTPIGPGGTPILLTGDDSSLHGRWSAEDQTTVEPFWAEVEVFKHRIWPIGNGQDSSYYVYGKIYDSRGQQPSVHFTFIDPENLQPVSLHGTPVQRGKKTFTPVLYIARGLNFEPIPNPTNTPLPPPSFTPVPIPSSNPSPWPTFTTVPNSPVPSSPSPSMNPVPWPSTVPAYPTQPSSRPSTSPSPTPLRR